MPKVLSVTAACGLSDGGKPLGRTRIAGDLRQQFKLRMSPAEEGFAALAADFSRFVRQQEANGSRRTPTMANTPPAHPVLSGVCAVTGCPSTGFDPTTPYLSSHQLQFDRGAFGQEPGLGSSVTAWMADGHGDWESVGYPRFRIDGPFLRWELACITPVARRLATHVRAGGRLSAEVDFTPLAERHEWRTRVVTRAAVRGLLLTVGGRPTFPLCDGTRVR